MSVLGPIYVGDNVALGFEDTQGNLGVLTYDEPNSSYVITVVADGTEVTPVIFNLQATSDQSTLKFYDVTNQLWLNSDENANAEPSTEPALLSIYNGKLSTLSYPQVGYASTATSLLVRTNVLVQYLRWSAGNLGKASTFNFIPLVWYFGCTTDTYSQSVTAQAAVSQWICAQRKTCTIKSAWTTASACQLNQTITYCDSGIGCSSCLGACDTGTCQPDGEGSLQCLTGPVLTSDRTALYATSAISILLLLILLVVLFASMRR